MKNEQSIIAGFRNNYMKIDFKARKISFYSLILLSLVYCFSAGAERRARKQYPVPNEKWRELPFIETNVSPKFNKVEKQRGYLIFQRPITQPVYENTIPQWFERIESLQGFAAQGEFKPLTFSIYPKRELKNLKVRISDLKNGSSIFPAKEIDIRLTTYWKLRYPLYTSSNTYRKLPELLEKVTVHTSPAKQCQRYWITIHPAKNAVPGIYTGTITLADEGNSETVKIPVKFRVLGYELKKDPNKHYSAFNYDLHQIMDIKNISAKELAWAKKADINEYNAMRDFGLDMAPSMYLDYDSKKDKIYLHQNGAAIAKMQKAGFKGPVPLMAGMVFDKLYAKHTGRKVKYYQHYKLPEAPKESFYKDVKRLFKQFEAERKKKNWPEFVYLPLDEVDPSAIDFGIKSYRAVKEAGCKIFATKRPTASDAAAYMPYVDIFCSQPFAVDYNKTQNSKYEYWSYPNHVAGEIKKPDVMCKGGRMTYGYGLWKSGYTTLIPWIWRWSHNRSFVFDYLKNPNLSETGNQLDENGEVIPTPYWMCFREGIDDLRYLYTLQSVILEREGSKDSDCNKLVAEGKKLVQEIWDSIEPLQKYENKGMWPDSEFTALRWKIAQLIEKLKKYPSVRNTPAPSIIANTSKIKKKEKDLLGKQARIGNVIIRDLGKEKFHRWKNITGEGKISISTKDVKHGKKAMVWRVKVDHATDGGGEKGAYPVGWPRIEINFSKNSLDMTRYDYLAMWIKIDSDRDEISDDYTYLAYTVSSWDTNAPRYLLKTEILGTVQQKVWLKIQLPIKQIIAKQAPKNKLFWRNIKRMEIFISENMYKHGTKLKFQFDDICLISLRQPVIKNLSLPHYVIWPAKYLMVKPEILGEMKKEYPLGVIIRNNSGKILFKKRQKLNSKGQMIIDISKLEPGNYILKMGTGKKKKSVSKETFQLLKGPAL